MAQNAKIYVTFSFIGRNELLTLQRSMTTVREGSSLLAKDLLRYDIAYRRDYLDFDPRHLIYKFYDQHSEVNV